MKIQTFIHNVADKQIDEMHSEMCRIAKIYILTIMFVQLENQMCSVFSHDAPEREI